MSIITEVAYLGRDNTIDLQLFADEVAQDLTGSTQIALVCASGGWTIDSDTYPSAFTWDASGVVTLTLADALSAESVSAGDYWVQLVVYDLTHTDGIMWENFRLLVV